ncbi:MAG: RlmE family RNA methyltransferase [Pseudomonadota bacterium]
MGSKLEQRKFRHDNYHQKAKQQNYPARSIYKLEELDRRFHLIKTGQRILDLGCRPGSWLLYVAKRVGPNGHVIGLDREALDIPLPDNAQMIVGDVLTIAAKTLRCDFPCFHTILSDMAPDTTGVTFADQVRSLELFERALELSLELGCPNGNFVCKLFMGEGFQDALSKTKQSYKQCKTVRPDATRKSSTEVYVVGQGRI